MGISIASASVAARSSGVGSRGGRGGDGGVGGAATIGALGGGGTGSAGPEHATTKSTVEATDRIAAEMEPFGQVIADYVALLLAGPHPWRKMRSVYRLRDLIAKYGRQRVEAACLMALDVAMVDIELVDGVIRPTRLRERIRAAGPTVRNDLGKQARSLAA